MSESTDLTAIRRLIETHAAAGAEIDAARLANGVLSDRLPALYALSDQVAAAWFSGHAYQNLRRMAREELNRWKPEESRQAAASLRDPVQAAFPEFEASRLQTYYVVERSGAQIHVPRWRMTPDEVRLKAKEHRDRSRAEADHAAELDRYADMLERVEAEVSAA